VVDAKGRMGEHPRVHEVDGKREFVLVGEDERCVLSKAEGERGRAAPRRGLQVASGVGRGDESQV